MGSLNLNADAECYAHCRWIEDCPEIKG